MAAIASMKQPTISKSPLISIRITSGLLETELIQAAITRGRAADRHQPAETGGEGDDDHHHGGIEPRLDEDAPELAPVQFAVDDHRDESA